MKKYHNKRIQKRDFAVGDSVLLFNFSLGLFLGKIESKWTRPFLITNVFPHVAVQSDNTKGAKFTVNGQ